MDLSMDPYSKILYWQQKSTNEQEKKLSMDKYYSQNEKNYCSNLQTESSEQTEFVSESQNFSLRLSDDSNTEDNGVIVITDSSLCSTPDYSIRTRQKQKMPSFMKNTNTNNVFNLDSSDSDSLEIMSDNFPSTWKPCTKLKSMETYQKQVFKKVDNKYNKSHCHQKDFDSNSDQYSRKQSREQDNHSDDILVSPTPDTQESDSRTMHVKKTSTVFHNESLIISSSLGSQSTSSYTDYSTHDKNLEYMQSHNKHVERGKTVKDKITRKDLRTIMDNIKASKAVYESPRQRNDVIINESLDSSTHPAVCNKDIIAAEKDRRKNKIVNETDSDLDDEIEGSQFDTFRPQKTPIENAYFEPREKTVYTKLSDRKKKEISHWLTTTPSRYSKSDSSFSNIPATNKSSIGSGNSSLERLELNYETPNNRGKIQRTIHQSPHQNTDFVNNHRPLDSIVNRETVLHGTVQKLVNLQNKDLGLQTPNQPTKGPQHKDNKLTRALRDSARKDTPKEIDVAECADILGKLYGDEWRSKANQLLPVSEPRRQNNRRIDRAVQTDKKKKQHRKQYASDSENDDSSASNIQSSRNSTGKDRWQHRTRRDSFINDGSSTSSDSISLYQTALTHPRTSTNSQQQKDRRVTGITKRIIAICDSETDDEKHKNSIKEQNKIDRKLLFSDDEDDTSSTSEFDPGDPVPPRSRRKKGREKVRQAPISNISKTTVSSINNGTREKTFLSSLSDTVPIVNAHPDAKKYRTNFKNNKEELSKKLYKLYNEKVFDNKLPDDMQIEWNVRMRGTAGFCYNRKAIKHLSGIQRSSRIVLATKILDTPDRLRDTLIHEMCHAAAWLINNVSDGHGPFWREWANKAMRIFPELPPIRRCHDYKIKTKFTYRCTGCAYSIGRHSKSLDIERKRCGHCYGKFELLINKTTKDGTVQVQTPKRGPSAFALYVKENYNTIKKQSNKKHADIMKLLGQQFSAMKVAKKQDNDKENDLNLDN